jgi:hypothetical protein
MEILNGNLQRELDTKDEYTTNKPDTQTTGGPPRQSWYCSNSKYSHKLNTPFILIPKSSYRVIQYNSYIYKIVSLVA